MRENVLFLTDDLWRKGILPHLGYAELCAVEQLNRQLRRLAGADDAWEALCTRHGFHASPEHALRFEDWRGWKAHFRMHTIKERRRRTQERTRRVLRLASAAQMAKAEVRVVRARLRETVREERTVRLELQVWERFMCARVCVRVSVLLAPSPPPPPPPALPVRCIFVTSLGRGRFE